MNDEYKKIVREKVDAENWNIIWIGGEMPCWLLDEPVELLYEDMDGYPCVCDAIYTSDRSNPTMVVKYFKRYDGARMMNCIAWRYPEKRKGAEHGDS